MKAKIAEIFESIQGEGLYQGVLQVFVRFFGCNSECCFCDTELKEFKEFGIDDLLKELERFKSPFHSISLTGGEPLHQAEFLKGFLKKIRPMDYAAFLETNGILHEELESVIDDIDIISMDFKLPSSTKQRPFWQEHREFLKIARKKKVSVKTVISGATKEEDLIRAIDIIEDIDGSIPFILQPDFYGTKLDGKLSRYEKIARERLPNVIIGRQMHKLQGFK